MLGPGTKKRYELAQEIPEALSAVRCGDLAVQRWILCEDSYLPVILLKVKLDRKGH